MEIKNIKYLSKEAKEAEILLSDGVYSLLCFSQPFEGKVTFPLQAIGTSNLFSSEKKEYFLKNIVNYEYCIKARITNIDENRVQIGEFVIELDNVIPKDLKNGDYLSFYCERIDVW